MKKLWLILALLHGMAYGQTIIITGKVLDAGGNAYQGGDGRVVLVPQNQTWLINGTNPVQSPVAISGLDSFGGFTISLPSTATISPQSAHPQWQFSFCSGVYTVQPKPVCFTMTPMSLTTSQDISTQIQAQSALLPNSGGGGVGSVQSVGAGTLPPLFTTSVANPTSHPIISFILSNAAANTIFGNPTNSIGPPVLTSTPSVTSVTVASGTASAPSIAFLSHATDGFYYNFGPTFSSTGNDIFAINISGGTSGPVGVPFGGGLSWYPTSGNIFTGAAQDVGISRLSTGKLSIDTSTTGNSAGSLALAGLNAATVSVANLTITGGCSGCPAGALNTISGATGAHTISSGGFPQTWQWDLGSSSSVSAFSLQDTSTSGGSGNILFNLATAFGSNTAPFRATAGANGIQLSSAGALSAIGSGTIAATTATKATNLSGGAAASIPYQTAANTTTFLPYGTDGQCVVGAGGVPTWGSCAGGGSITGSGLVATQVAVATSSSAVTSYSTFTSDASGNVTAHTLNLPAGGTLKSADTGTPTINFGTNLITTSKPLNVTTGFQIGGAAASGNYLRGNGTNFVSNTIQAGDIPDLSGSYLALTGGTLTGNLLFSTDGTLDIGALAATRPRDGNFTRHIVSADYTSTATASPDVYKEQAAPGGSPSATFLDQWADSTDHRLHDKNSSGIVGTTAISNTCTSSNWFNGMSGAGIFACTQPAVADVTGAAALAGPVFTDSSGTVADFTNPTAPSTGASLSLGTLGTVSGPGSAGKGALYFDNFQNYGLAMELATNVTWPVTQAVINTGAGTVVFTLSTPVNGISWGPTDCFQVASLPATDGLSSLNGVNLAVTSKSSGTPTSTVTITIAGTATSCQAGTVGSGLSSATVGSLTATADHYDMVLNGNTIIYNRLVSSSSNCPNWGSIRLCSGGTTSSDALTAYDPTTTDMFPLIRRNPIATTGSNWAQVGDSTHATYAPGGVQTASLLATGIVDGTVPVTLSTSGSVTLGGTYNSGYTFNQDSSAAAAITYTLPTAATGKQFCISNSYNGSAATTGTLEFLTSAAGQFIIYTDGTLSASGGYVISGGVAGDAACVIGVDATHWQFYINRGIWAKH